MKKIIIAILLLLVAGVSVFSYKKYVKCEKMEFSTILNKEYIYVDNGVNTNITLAFTDDRVYGTSGVNRYFAGYKIEANMIQFSPIGNTMMAGPENEMESERKFLNLLNNVDKIEAYKTKLILKTKDNEILKFVLNANPVKENEINVEMVGPEKQEENSEIYNQDPLNQVDQAMDMDSGTNTLSEI